MISVPTYVRGLLGLLLLAGIAVASASSRQKEYNAQLSQVRDRKISHLVPPFPENGTIPVEVDFDLRRVMSLNSDTATLNALGTLRVSWLDPRLSWSGGLSSLILSADDLWTPQLTLATSPDIQGSIASSVRLSRSGRATVERTMMLSVACEVDVRLFPRDLQQCSLRFMAPIGYRQVMTPVHFANLSRARRSVKQVGEEWILLGSIHESTMLRVEDAAGAMAVSPGYRLTVLLGRQHAFYLLTIIMPSAMLALFMLVPFALPPSQNQAKLLIPVTTFLSINIYMLLLEKSLPKSRSIPVLGEIYAILLATGVITEIVQAFSVKFYSCRVKKVPKLLHFFYLRFLAKLLCYGVCHGDEHLVVVTGEVDDDLDDSDKEAKTKNQVHKQWQSIGRINDRCGLVICTILVLAAFIILFIRCYALVEFPSMFREDSTSGS